MRVLLVQGPEAQELALRQGLEANLKVDMAGDGQEADLLARGVAHEVIILDLVLPGIDGLALLRRWRRDGLKTHVLVLGGGEQAGDRARWLDSGADDCLSGPVALPELLARLRALARRPCQVEDPVIRVLDLEVDPPSRGVKRAGQEVPLTPLEYSLLEFLALHRGRVAMRTMIWEHLYGEREQGTSNVVDVYIRYLRNKMTGGSICP
jgi:DNA-binding response OmpR family regulator